MKKILVCLGVMVCILASICTSSPWTLQAKERTITWQATLFCNESSGQKDYAVFGEAPDAHDGAPPDAYDVVKPPTPMIPFVSIYLRDNLPAPYNYLWEDFRQYPDASKVWNVSVQWVPEDGESPSDVVLSWNPASVSESEYTSVNLCTNTGAPLKNMLVETSYTFTCPAYGVQNFKIIGERNNTPPVPPSLPAGVATGYHGTPYSYTTAADDPNLDPLYYRFSWGDNTTSAWLGPYPSGQSINASHTWTTPGLYPLKAKAKDQYGGESGWSDELSVTMGNRAPALPTSPSPENGATGVDVRPTLRWTCTDPDKDIVTYDVYFGASNNPPLVISGQSSIFFLPGNLMNQTTYSWRIVAWDPYGLKSTGPVWSFTTSSSEGSPGGGNNTEEQNLPPVADASASEQIGFPGVGFVLNGSRSGDPDGYLTSWSWEFGDGTSGTGEIITHVYQTRGTYQVTLTVIDNEGATDSDTLTVQIIAANHPPTQPVINGAVRGTKNKMYVFTASATDSENDFLQYRITWGDGSQNISGFLPNGTPCFFSHSWKAAGRYRVAAIASDNITESEQGSLWVFIDVYFVGGTGFLFDANADNVNDSFFSNTTNTTTRIQKLTDGRYRLDTNGDGRWDAIYNPTSGALASISDTETEGINPYVLLAVIGVVIALIAGVVFWVKRR